MKIMNSKVKKTLAYMLCFSMIVSAGMTGVHSEEAPAEEDTSAADSADEAEEEDLNSVGNILHLEFALCLAGLDCGCTAGRLAIDKSHTGSKLVLLALLSVGGLQIYGV